MSVLARLGQMVGIKAKAPRVLHGVDDSRHWLTIGDWKTGAWQQDMEINETKALANWALFSCMTLIASDIGKVNLRLMRKNDRIWEEEESPAFSPVIRKPNGYQTRQQFMESWILSKLSVGNTYVLKERDQRGVVVKLHVLDPFRVQTLVAENGEVFYQLQQDELAGLRDDFPAVPASEIIHDRFNCLFNPLVGLSPIYACGLAATQGLKIQQNSAKFFGNMSRPSGILSAPGSISNETAERLQKKWESNYTGDKIGKVAVLGDDLKYQSMGITAVDSQMVEQLKMTAEMICSTMHVPAFKIGAGVIPAGQKVADLNEIYYADCLHALMDAIQTLLSQGVGLSVDRVYQFDLYDLLKMDMASLMNFLKIGVDGAIYSPDEARQKVNLAPVPGGKYPLSQQQNYSLEALAKRDAQADPFATNSPDPAPVEEAPQESAEERAFRFEYMAAQTLRKELELE